PLGEVLRKRKTQVRAPGHDMGKRAAEEHGLQSHAHGLDLGQLRHARVPVLACELLAGRAWRDKPCPFLLPRPEAIFDCFRPLPIMAEPCAAWTGRGKVGAYFRHLSCRERPPARRSQSRTGTSGGITARETAAR